jgi:hypothetical protein
LDALCLEHIFCHLVELEALRNQNENKKKRYALIIAGSSQLCVCVCIYILSSYNNFHWNESNDYIIFHISMIYSFLYLSGKKKLGYIDHVVTLNYSFWMHHHA